ncbi:DUF4097 family beta strand repeat-containing protein [Anaeromicropila herbilytica]|uniref:DUF4097 domain-containing protein n=1 Tax=Anaeromicropila herbilytica TaxID=2785025 RepID=A0A7R7EHR2_9FIRM|nr:DUF4097 family beta strand repeat-containing protein [Anaeromicropila herbilytica]BCN28974.1 hypothetical protein bsdtb5_02690 [Anaeromicropila herbilytica]
MKSFKRVMYTVAGGMILLGIILAIVGFLLGGGGLFTINSHGISSNNSIIHFQHGKIMSNNYSTFKQKKIALGNIKNIKINTNDSNIRVIESDSFSIEYTYLSGNGKPCHTVKDGELIYDEPNTNGFSFSWGDDNDDNYYINLYIPKNASLDSFDIDSSSGDISVSNFTAKSLSINSSYGDVDIDNVISTNTKVKLSSGDSEITNINTDVLDYNNSYGNADFSSINTLNPTDTNKNGKISLTLSSGDTTIDKCTANKLEMKNSYGDIELSQVNATDMTGDLSSGSITAENCDLGNTNIDSKYGDVTLGLSKAISMYDYNINCDYGDVTIDNSEYEGNVLSSNNHPNKITIDASSGDVDLSFLK